MKGRDGEKTTVMSNTKGLRYAQPSLALRPHRWAVLPSAQESCMLAVAAFHQKLWGQNPRLVSDWLSLGHLPVMLAAKEPGKVMIWPCDDLPSREEGRLQTTTPGPGTGSSKTVTVACQSN